MKAIYIVFLALAGCGGGVVSEGNGTEAPVSVSTVAAIQAQVTALQGQIAELKLVGKVATTASTDSVHVTYQSVTPVNFGTCSNMGVLVGSSSHNPMYPLTQQLQVFKTCTGYQYVATSAGGAPGIPPYAVWDGPNCTGKLYIETDIPSLTYDSEALTGGIVFSDPLGGQAVYYVAAGAVPGPVLAQSAFNTTNPNDICGAVNATVQGVIVSPNVTSITGVPNAIPAYTLAAP